jgi:hypothetical protein
MNNKPSWWVKKTPPRAYVRTFALAIKISLVLPIPFALVDVAPQTFTSGHNAPWTANAPPSYQYPQSFVVQVI